MKSPLLLAGLLFTAAYANAQDTYSNLTTTSTADVIGTSRYVGMGGAMGALGADISTISSNPAGLALMRKSDISLTAGVNFPANKAYGNAYSDRTTRGTFDQMGFVWAIPTDGTSPLKSVSVGMNYQKRANFNRAFLADNNNLGGLSQMQQVSELEVYRGSNDSQGNFNGTNALAMNAYDANLYGPADLVSLDKNNNIVKKPVNLTTPASANRYAHFTTGGIMGYDFNLSFNVNDRAYFGATLGVDDVRYNRFSEYSEVRGSAAEPQDYTIYEDQRIDGTGVNLKLGTIIRPIEESPFRIGLAFETPTWYRMKSSTLVDISSKYEPYTVTTPDKTQSAQGLAYLGNGSYYTYKMDENYLEYRVRTPWKMRLSLGSTVDKILAWGIEYEFANTTKYSTSYPKNDYSWGGSNNYVKDLAVNRMTKDNLRGQHTLRFGVEVRPIDHFAFRVGYNYISSPYKSNAHYDQFAYIDPKDPGISNISYATNTSFLKEKAANILTLGLGYKYKSFYADLAYKYRYQKADFYAFDTNYTTRQNTDLTGVTATSLAPTEVDLSRHNITATIGVRF